MLLPETVEPLEVELDIAPVETSSVDTSSVETASRETASVESSSDGTSSVEAEVTPVEVVETPADVVAEIAVVEVPEEVAEAADTEVVAGAAAAASVTSPVAPSTAKPPRPAEPPRTVKPPRAAKPPRAPKRAPVTAAAPSTTPEDGVVLRIDQLTKRFGDTVAVDQVSLSVPAGTIFGLVGPNGAGKTTTLSMVTGLLRPDSGTITVHGADVWSDPVVAKRNMGVLPDRLRLFDRLTGAQLLYYAGTLRGLDAKTVKKRTADLAAAFGLEDALNRLVTDYSAGMTKKIALACAMIHSPRVLILDEPFESVDPVSAANVTEILQNYVAAGGTVVLSSHSMDLIQRICDLVAIVVAGKVLAAGTTEEVRGTGSLEQRFVELAGGRKTAEGMEWLHSFSD